jgi:hypothetical protein
MTLQVGKRMGGAFALFLGPLGTGGSATNSVKLIALFFLLLSLMKATSWPLNFFHFLQGTVADQSGKQDSGCHRGAPVGNSESKTEQTRTTGQRGEYRPLAIPPGTVPIPYNGQRYHKCRLFKRVGQAPENPGDTLQLAGGTV